MTRAPGDHFLAHVGLGVMVLCLGVILAFSQVERQRALERRANHQERVAHSLAAFAMSMDGLPDTPERLEQLAVVFAGLLEPCE